MFAYEHDAAGILTAIRENGGTVVASFSYNTGGRVAAQSASAVVTDYGYDGVFRLTALHHNLAGTSADYSTVMAHNPASQIVARSSANAAYAYTGHVNLSRSYAVNGLNQYTSAGPATFAYDANGNLTSDGSVSMVYDAENRLISASGAKTASLGYDPLGRLFQTGGGSAGVTQFLYDGDELVAEYNGSGALLRRYVHGLGTDDPVLWYEGAGLADRRSLQADHQGSIIGVANSAGASIAINAYDEWGVPNAGNQGRFQYTGQAWLPELGMYHYKARIYSPTLGRFLQTDPIGYEDQVNLYAYVGNDPVNVTDPSGLCGTRIEGRESAGCSGETVLANIEQKANEVEAAAQQAVAQVVKAANQIAEAASQTVDLVDEALVRVESMREWNVASVVANYYIGKSFENSVRRNNNLKENKTSYAMGSKKTIPDSMQNGVHEIKWSRYVYFSSQLRAQNALAAKLGMPHYLWIRKEADVSRQIIRAGIEVRRCNSNGECE